MTKSLSYKTLDKVRGNSELRAALQVLLFDFAIDKIVESSV